MPGIHPDCFQAAAELPLLQDKAGAGEATGKILENIFIFIHSGRRTTVWWRYCSCRTVVETGKLFEKFKVCFRFFYCWTWSNNHKIIIASVLDFADSINILLFWIFSPNLNWKYLNFLPSFTSSLKKNHLHMVDMLFKSETLLIFQDSALTFLITYLMQKQCRVTSTWKIVLQASLIHSEIFNRVSVLRAAAVPRILIPEFPLKVTLPSRN